MFKKHILHILSFLVVRQLEIHQRHVLVAVAGIRISLRAVWPCTVFILLELYGFLRAVLYAGKAELAVALHLYPLRSEVVVATRTHVAANAAVDAGVGYRKALLCFPASWRAT